MSTNELTGLIQAEFEYFSPIFERQASLTRLENYRKETVAERLMDITPSAFFTQRNVEALFVSSNQKRVGM